MSTARETALKLLERCRRDGAWPERMLDMIQENAEMSAQDAALTAKLSLGVIQNSRYLDYYIDYYCRSGKLEPKLRDILRLGAYQILFLDRIPSHAAVDETVSLCRRSGLSRASGLVNAVLRRLSEHKNALPVIPGEGTASYLAIRFSQSEWLTEELIHQRGYEFTEAFFKACQEPAATELQINTLKIEPSAYKDLLSDRAFLFECHDHPEACVSLKGGRVTDLPGYKDGLFYVQDRAAAMAVELAEPKPGMRVLDACAAPGGKSFAAAIRMANRGSILSCDLHEKKLSMIESGADRLGIDCIRTLAHDAGEDVPAWKNAFDLVIADLPCSGFGVMRKKPDIRLKNQEDAAAMPDIQRRILDTLAAYVVPGGTLLYSTCTVLRQENEKIVSEFLRRHPEYRPVDFNVGPRLSENGCYTFWPHIDGTDGFFAAKLIREIP